MEIGGIDILTNLSKEYIVEICFKKWKNMWYQGVDDDVAIPYTNDISLENEFFLYRDESAYKKSDDDFEGMIYVISESNFTTVVYDCDPSSDVKEIVWAVS
jgi:hypothetical protein